ncbi:MAG: alpha/beta hydrolase [Caldilinea sp. CFX5]|nr:alpha/beta hydrolase [Caldilinea sp. CFX5]
MSEFVTATGSIFYEVIPPPGGIGQPQTLTLLHNFMSTGRSAWGPLLAQLAQRFRLLLPDLPGHGRSQGYPAGFHYGAMAEQVAALMRAEGADHGHLAGCSAGGMIAQLLVNQRLVQPASLTLVSTTYSTAPQVTGQGQSLKPETFRAGRRWMEATAQLHDPYHYPGYYAEVLLTHFRRLKPAASIDLPLDALRTWMLPVCLIHGAEDEFFPPVIVEQMAAALPNAEVHLLPGQPHALIFRQPWKVAELMAAFLNRITQP